MNDNEPPSRWNQEILPILLVAILLAALVCFGTQGFVAIGRMMQAQAAPEMSVR